MVATAIIAIGIFIFWIVGLYGIPRTAGLSVEYIQRRRNVVVNDERLQAFQGFVVLLYIAASLLALGLYLK